MAKKRMGKGYGYLYKVLNGKEYPATSSVQGFYWLQLKIDGKRKKVALKNEDGTRVDKIEDAIRIRQKFITPLLLQEQKQVMEFIQTQIQTIEQQKKDAIVEQKNLLDNTNVRVVDAIDVYTKKRATEKLCKRWLEHTISTVERFLEFIIEHYPSITFIAEITNIEIKAYINELEKYSANTFNCITSVLKQFFDIVLEEYHEQNPSWLSPLRKIKHKKVNSVNSHKRRNLTELELRAVLEQAKLVDNSTYLLFLIGATTGLRLKDVCFLKWCEVDVKSKVIKKLATKTLRYGKPEVICPLLPIVEKELDQLDRTNEFILPKYAALYNETKRSVITHTIAKVFKNSGILTKEARSDGVNCIVKVGYHSLRSGFCTAMADNGVPIAVIMKSTGHSSDTMALSYMRIGEQQVRDAATKLHILDNNEEK